MFAVASVASPTDVCPDGGCGLVDVTTLETSVTSQAYVVVNLSERAMRLMMTSSIRE